MSKEKRKHKRLPTTIMADIYDSKTLEIKGKGCVFDLSKSGIAVETNLKIDKEKPFFMRLNIPMEVLCKVVRVKQREEIFCYGLKFSKLKMSDAVKLKRIVFDD